MNPLRRLRARLFRRAAPDGQDPGTLRLALTAKQQDLKQQLDARQQELQDVLSSEQSLAVTGVAVTDRVNRALFRNRIRQLEEEVEAVGANILQLQGWNAAIARVSTNEKATVPWDLASLIQDWLHESAHHIGETDANTRVITEQLVDLRQQHQNVIDLAVGENVEPDRATTFGTNPVISADATSTVSSRVREA